MKILKNKSVTIKAPKKNNLAANELGGAAGRMELPYFMQKQTQSNWCWAACGASVGNYYHGQNSFTQCRIANACQKVRHCCHSPRACDRYGLLDLALKAAHSFDGMHGGTISFNEIKNNLNNGRPVGTRVAWYGGGAHFMMITGYSEGAGPQMISIQDPINEFTTILFSHYARHYYRGGNWTTTYFT